MDALEAIRRRHMHRALSAEVVDPAAVARIAEAALRAPSAGHTQAVHLTIATDPEVRRRILATLTTPGWLEARPRFAGLRRAPVLVVLGVDPEAYAVRYREPDKAPSGLGHLDAWPVPYWWVDAGCALEGLLVAATAEGLGAAVLGTFRGEAELIRLAGMPATARVAATVALGHPLPEAPGGSAKGRPRRPTQERVVTLDPGAQDIADLLGRLFAERARR